MSVSITSERGLPKRLGATPTKRGVEFAVTSENADWIHLCLFDESGTREVQRLRLPGAADGVRFGFVPDLKPGARYGLRAEGPFNPAAGHRFDPSKLLVDPYAIRLDRPFIYHPVLAAPADQRLDSAPYVPRAIVCDPERHAAPLASSTPGFVYELHVRGFSQRHPAVADPIRGTLAALCEPALLDHIAALGVDTVELMPIAAWIDERHLSQLGLTNAWGYNPITHMALDPRLAPGGPGDLRRVVDGFHHRGIRVLLDVVFNHSGEGPAEGPTLSYRGLDNALYYRHAEDGALINDTGCGNTFACDREPVARLVLDTLRHFVETAGVDGFRYDLAPVLGRDAEGFSPAAPLLRTIADDPLLKDCIHIAESWDIGPGGYRVGEFPPPFYEWQDRFRDDVRRFWRGDPAMVGDLATRLAGSADIFGGARRRPSVGVNMIAPHDGFCLADLTAFVDKHNAANGEDNRDGHGENFSWNQGVEGPVADHQIQARRQRDVRALLATLFVSRGSLMIVAGDEIGRTQRGNNNAYCQDNETLWLDWAAADLSLAAFVARLARLRRDHPALSADRFLTGNIVEGDVEDVVWLTEAGTPMRDVDWHDPTRHCLAMSVYAPRRSTDDNSERALIYLNAAASCVEVRLPAARPRHRFTLFLRSDEPGAETLLLPADGTLTIAPRAVYVILEQHGG
ncbi:glycogen debranching protein GlgX [Jiella sp. MQZ9-1]|uniref:Glycogen debranching protein GlgX n=1 Tax=Jiella flava TaxID=2816857 RepID=A0A939G0K1_9HYPH|nr:glycogen debranching protein GlgX [Jiella flava]MBO0663625.1 glycogen debranching protein GlgX [Jiella flava]MCD2472200.1 glycogen debranching protein GlgX [Jiella flava]